MKTPSPMMSYYESTMKYLQSNEEYIKHFHPFSLSNNFVSKFKENGSAEVYQPETNKINKFSQQAESNILNRGSESDTDSFSEKSTSQEGQSPYGYSNISSTPLNLNLYQLANINRPLFVPSKYMGEEKSENESSSDRTSTSTSKKDENENEEPDYLVQMFGRKGWVCKLCHNFNYETRTKCNRCKVLRLPENILGYKFKKKSKGDEGDSKNKKKERERKKNDWFCVNCRNLNYAFRKVCNRCKAPKICYSINNLLTYSMMNNNNFDMPINNECLLYKPLFEPNVDL